MTIGFMGSRIAVPAGTRTLNILDVGRHLAEDDLDPPLRALFIYNHNPIVVHPDQNRMRRGLAREDVFTIGIDVAMTESLAHCDIVLPAATHFEYADLYPSYGHHWLQRAEPVIPPLGESLPNTEIFRRLAARFGYTEPCFTATDAELMDDAVDMTDPRLGGVRPSEIPTRRALQMAGPDGKALVLFDNVFPATPSGKIELKSEALAERWGAAARLPTWREREAAEDGRRRCAGVSAEGLQPDDSGQILWYRTGDQRDGFRPKGRVRQTRRAYACGRHGRHRRLLARAQPPPARDIAP